MDWRLKALIMSVLGHMPGGDLVYAAGQRRFGRLSADPFRRVPQVTEIVSLLKRCGCGISGKRFLEIGTGHKPIIPILLWAVGASEVVTLDLHRRFNEKLSAKMIRCLVDQRDRLSACLADVIEDTVEFQRRMDYLAGRVEDLGEFLSGGRITYMAPCDARATGLQAGSFDYHCSCTVLEHIPETVLRGIFSEARRLLKPDGRAVHLVDLSDHFQHQDPSISRINFLKFSRLQWSLIASNEYAYCNRLRAPDYLRVLNDTGWRVEASEALVDGEAMEALKRGFRVHPDYKDYAADALCTMSLRFVASSDIEYSSL